MPPEVYQDFDDGDEIPRPFSIHHHQTVPRLRPLSLHRLLRPPQFFLLSFPPPPFGGRRFGFLFSPPCSGVIHQGVRDSTDDVVPDDPNPNWSNRPPKETILLDGCDFEHWLVVMEKPEGDPTRDEIIDSYIKTLSMVVGSLTSSVSIPWPCFEEEARMKIYSVSTRHYYAFGALVSEELSYKLKELPRVRWVLPDSYLDVKNKDYGGEPFINGQAVPYDPKYHEEWVRNNARANERNRRNDRPRNFDRSRNFERRREMQMNQNPGPNVGGPGPNMGGQPNMAPPPPNAPNTGGMQSNMGGQPNYGEEHLQITLETIRQIT
ncbi:Multiple organellar RNA editing factor 8, chloroplastic/mitochondrial [Sesamum angolense]|uniref:Multiple organellar RNA editing factor 8, chloroplastic/mitochondrial n=1 Tax=Sesamum angolense TaxID=2727404 RepID=A0AAE1VZ26_9LAMI|nr:Multiple organellar RNA editing factor 8, chloroplastic/mitochondrial [Sesamum angolense]